MVIRYFLIKKQINFIYYLFTKNINPRKQQGFSEIKLKMKIVIYKYYILQILTLANNKGSAKLN